MMSGKLHALKNQLIEDVERRDKRIYETVLHPAELVALRNQNNVIIPIITKLEKILHDEN